MRRGGSGLSQADRTGSTGSSCSHAASASRTGSGAVAASSHSWSCSSDGATGGAAEGLQVVGEACGSGRLTLHGPSALPLSVSGLRVVIDRTLSGASGVGHSPLSSVASRELSTPSRLYSIAVDGGRCGPSSANTKSEGKNQEGQTNAGASPGSAKLRNASRPGMWHSASVAALVLLGGACLTAAVVFIAIRLTRHSDKSHQDVLLNNSLRMGAL